MTEQDLFFKKAYFQDQALLEISDDEQPFNDESSQLLERAFADCTSIKAPSLLKKTSSFLGPTPREVLEFRAFTEKQRATLRKNVYPLARSLTAPQHESTKMMPIVRSLSDLEGKKAKRSGRDFSTSHAIQESNTPFYKLMGNIPREVKSGKNVNLAEDIKLEAEHKRLLQNKIVYVYPNDDISLARRARIHKIIQLGAAWVTRWRDDITHIVIDYGDYTYSQLLQHLNKARLPKRAILVQYDPYIPQCIQCNTLLDPSASRFSVKGAPKYNHHSQLRESYAAGETSCADYSKNKASADLPGQVDTQFGHASSSASESNTEQPSGVVERVVDSFSIPSIDQAEVALKNINHRSDALSQAIEEMKSVAHLPLDDDEDGNSSGTTPLYQFDDSGTDEESPEPPARRVNLLSKASAIRDKKQGLDLNTFQCMNPGANVSVPNNPNARTINILEEMCNHYDQMQDTWRTLAYRKGIATLRKQTKKITTAKQAAGLPFIGSRLAKKIEEIVLTNRLHRLDSTRHDPLDTTLRLFMGVYGAGPVQASKWLQTGYQTLEDLQSKASLTESQKIGVEHYNDFNSRISRAEVAAHGAIVKQALKKIDDKVEATIMGSYRRGATDSSDIDLLFTKPGASLTALQSIVYNELVPTLYAHDFLKASLAAPRSNDLDGTKWHGASCLPSSEIWRRMDFLLVPEEEMGAALLYFTGNDVFNRSIRLLARKKGMLLNQRGLYKGVKRGLRGVKLNSSVLVEGRDERKIFEALGVPWREPHERVC